MQIPLQAKICPYCRKRLEASAAAKILSVFVAIIAVAMAWGVLRQASNGGAARSNEGTIVGRGFACRSAETYRSIRRMAVQDHDEAGFTKALAREMRDEDCVEVTRGTKVFKTDIDGGLIKFRQEGDPVEYWTIQEAVE